MLLHLIKKDFVIVKKYVLFMIIVVLLIPPFILHSLPSELTGSISFAISAVYAVFMLLMFVCVKEFQFPKAAALLCASPYPRSMIVLSKYCFCIVIFAACCVLYWLETLLLPQLGTLSLETVLAAFAGIVLLISIYLPIQFKLGYVKTRFFFIVVIMVAPFLLPRLPEIGGSPFLTVIRSMPPALLCALLAGFSLLLLILSAIISIGIYKNKDLV